LIYWIVRRRKMSTFVNILDSAVDLERAVVWNYRTQTSLWYFGSYDVECEETTMDTTSHRPIILPRLRSGTVLTVRFTLTAVLWRSLVIFLRILVFESSELLSSNSIKSKDLRGSRLILFPRNFHRHRVPDN